MLSYLSDRLGRIFDPLKKQALLSENNILEAIRAIRIALLEADVALPVVKTLLNGIKEKAIGQQVLNSVTPGQQVVKIVRDELVAVLGSDASFSLKASPPVYLLMVGLQGSGKTTTSAKLGLYLKKRLQKKVLLVSLDLSRPAAQEQLALLGRQADLDVLPPGRLSLNEIADQAMSTAKTQGYDVVVFDTAGRQTLDTSLMQELKTLKARINPLETMLVVDALTGQDALTLATNFDNAIGLSGLIPTRVESDARGGALLSIRFITEKPIHLIGTGEKLEDLEIFYPDRLANRLLGMGDVVTLVEKAAALHDQETPVASPKGRFSLEDFLAHLQKINRAGGLSSFFSFLPSSVQRFSENIDPKQLAKTQAIISSMTRQERQDPTLLNASRKRRIAKGSATKVQDVNQVLKQYHQIRSMTKKVAKLGPKALRGLSLPFK